MPYINTISTAVPKYKYDQMEIAEFMGSQLPLTVEEKSKLQLLYRRSSIKNRHSVLPNYKAGHDSKEAFGVATSVEEKMKFFNQQAPSLASEAAESCLKAVNKDAITHLITVTCTGLSAPGVEHELIQLLGLKKSTARLAVNFVGCYAAFHALKMANDICIAHDEAQVLIICVELCSIHFQEDLCIDNLVANSLFADGAAAALVTNQIGGFKLGKFYTEVYPDGREDMAWGISSKGFLMKLSAYIPSLIENAMSPLLMSALANANLTKSEITHYVIHPGGRKILEAVLSSLDLEKEQLNHSYKVLENFGNMSSPTILFVLQELLNSNPEAGQVFVAGFGPGLTLETAMLEI